MIKPIVALSILFLTFVNTTFSQVNNGKIILVNDSANINEPSVTINKKNPQQIFACSYSDKENFYISNNGGATWNKQRMDCSYGMGMDAYLTSNKSGAVFYFHLSESPKTISSDRIVCRTSTDGGLHFSDGATVGKDSLNCQERPTALYDDAKNILHLVWTEFDVFGSNRKGDSTRVWYTQSLDTGKTFIKPILINRIQGDCMDQDGSLMGVTICKLNKNTLCASWASIKGIMYTISKDYGKTWAPEKKVGDIINGYDYQLKGIVMPEGLPNMKTDNKGNVYINFSMQLNDGNSDSYIIKSKNKGKRWSKPVPIVKHSPDLKMFTSWMTIDPSNNNIYTINYSLNPSTNEIGVWLNTSTDKGKSFKNELLETFKNTKPELYVGDYIMIDAYEGKIAAVWTSLINDKTVLKYYTNTLK